MRRPAPSELVWPDDPADADLPQAWAQGVAIQALSWTWRAFDRLQQELLVKVDLRQPLEQVERDLTRNHFVELQKVYQAETEGFSVLIPVHEWPEMETRSPAPAKPPAYDLGFVHPENRRWAWPIEAKVLKTPGTLADYLADVLEKYDSGVAAPLVGEGGMIAYLLSGVPAEFFSNLQERLPNSLVILPEFAHRAHRASTHQRKNAPELRLHHMAMACQLLPDHHQR